MKIIKGPLLISALILLSAITSNAAPNVVASIKPVHSLVSAVMSGVGQPSLLVRGADSPHSFAMRPSDAKALQDADLVFWIGPNFEAFLSAPLASLAGNATIVTLDQAPDLQLLAQRKGGAFDADQHEGEADAHQNEKDMHLWLDPQNAIALVATIEQILTSADPANATTYAANAQALNIQLAALETEIAAQLAALPSRPFVVFHDAYQYFEHRFGRPAAGSITVSPEQIPGARRLSDIRDKIRALGAVCVFSEPQFTPKLIEIATEGTNASSGALDPLGADLAPGPALYPSLMRNLAKAFADCLLK